MGPGFAAKIKRQGCRWGNLLGRLVVLRWAGPDPTGGDHLLGHPEKTAPALVAKQKGRGFPLPA